MDSKELNVEKLMNTNDKMQNHVLRSKVFAKKVNIERILKKSSYKFK